MQNVKFWQLTQFQARHMEKVIIDVNWENNLYATSQTLIRDAAPCFNYGTSGNRTASSKQLSVEKIGSLASWDVHRQYTWT